MVVGHITHCLISDRHCWKGKNTVEQHCYKHVWNDLVLSNTLLDHHKQATRTLHEVIRDSHYEILAAAANAIARVFMSSPRFVE